MFSSNRNCAERRADEMKKFLLIGLVCGGLALAQKPDAADGLRAYKELEAEYTRALADFQKAYRAALTPEQRQKAQDKHPRPAAWAPRFMAIAEKYPSSPAAVDALSWVVLHPVAAGEPAADARQRALRRLQTKYIRDERLGRLCTQLVQTIDPASVEFMKTALEKSKSSGVRARACASLAQNLKYRGRLIPRLRDDEEAIKGYEQAWGKPAVRALLKGDPKALLALSEQRFEEVVEKYGDVKHPVHGSLANLAKSNLLSLRRPVTIGQVAPNIARDDLNGKKLRLSDYRGKVVLLDFWSHAFPSCRAGYEIERGLMKRLAGKPFAILGVNADADKEALAATMESEKIIWPSWYDGGYPGGPIATRWDVEVWPTLFLIDRKGVVRKRFLGWGDRKALDEAIDHLVGEAGKP
jgi:thiol-disulfide isomerase/thioredoxin